MNVYAISQFGGDGWEVLPWAFKSLESAQHFVLGRVGAKCEWTEHNSHGLCWTEKRGLYRIDALELER